MTKTEKNLREAFAGESQANRKYLAFARKADEEGLAQVARLFRAAAEAETIHAHAHLRVLKGVGTTEQNLSEALNGETHEFTAMYPVMIREAEQEGDRAAKTSFDYANAVEKVHAALYRRALEAKGKLPDAVYFVCGICGNTVEGSAPERCPICNAPAKAFKRVD